MTSTDRRAEFLAQHPEVRQPYHLMGGDFYIYLHGDDQREQLAVIARAMGSAEKKVDGDKYLVSRQFAGITLIAQANRDAVCERIVVGSHEVTRQVKDPEALAAVPMVSVTEVVEDVEWRCAESILKPTDLPILPPIDSDAWDDHADPVPLPHPVFNGSDAALPQVGGESVEDASSDPCDECETTGRNCLAHGGLPYQRSGMSDSVDEFVADQLASFAKMRGYEDPAVSA